MASRKSRSAARKSKPAAKGLPPKKAKPAAAKPAAVIGHPTRAFTAIVAAPVVPITIAGTVGDGGLISAKLNGQSLTFSSGAAHAIASHGQTNTLEWRVIGPAGVTWSIGVKEPAGADCGDSGTLDGDGKEAGSCNFGT